MANALNALNIANSAAVSVQMSTAINVSAPLTGGVYAVWGLTQAAYIDVGSPVSTALATTTGYLVPSGVQPIQINVPQGFQIGCISSSSGLFLYQQVG